MSKKVGDISPREILRKIEKVFPDSSFHTLEVPFATRSKNLNMLSLYNHQSKIMDDTILNYLEDMKFFTLLTNLIGPLTTHRYD